jgi:8-oxo-dGTP pyrophosphatase MutT (NUDIX family)
LEEPKIYAAGILLFALKPKLSFLLLKHPTRWDLPKGHLEHSESLKECALREFYEETGIYPDLIKIVSDFEFVTSYYTKTKKHQNKPMLKELTIYLALIEHTPEVKLSEHPMYEWVVWSPPHKIQNETIDPLLEKVHDFWKKQAK